MGLLDKTCGNKRPSNITSKTNKASITFHSDDSVTNKGFRAVWRAVDRSGGVIQTPNYPKTSPAFTSKTWPLEAPVGKRIRLTFQTFELEENSCDYDYVEVSFENFKKKYCGTRKPGQITSSSNKMTVKFKSDSSDNFQGFSAKWEVV